MKSTTLLPFYSSALLFILLILLSFNFSCSENISVDRSGCQKCPDRCLTNAQGQGRCVACLNDEQCQTKASPTKRCNEQHHCVCGTDKDCPEGLHCAGKLGCVECSKNADCLDTNKPICDLSYHCVECEANKVRSCAPKGRKVCREGVQKCHAGAWGECKDWVICKMDERCENQKCVPDCPKESCQLGERRCSSEDGLQRCVKDERGCLVWSEEEACPKGTKCRDSLKRCTVCVPHSSRYCYTGPAGTAGVGECKAGKQLCKKDGSGYLPCQGEILPKPEGCDGRDDNCDGRVGVGCECLNGQRRYCFEGTHGCLQKSSGYQCQGICRSGEQLCINGKWGPCKGQILPNKKEQCDGLDDDCDGQTDEGCQCRPGSQQPCGSKVGECKQGIQRCRADGKWGICQGAIAPIQELCDGKDNDCDGKVDEDFPKLGKACKVGKGECLRRGHFVCNHRRTGIACDVKPAPAKPELCDGKDNDCDGKIDEDFARLGKKCFVGLGACRRRGQFICKKDGSAVTCNVNQGKPTRERCDGKDNDCDGKTDEDLTRSCYTGDPKKLGVGECKKGFIYCRKGHLTKCLGEVKPQAERCDNQKDDDCDGAVDERSGRALKFTGHFAHVEVAHTPAFNLSGSFTIELWVNIDSLGPKNISLLVNKHHAAINKDGFHLKVQGANSQCAFSWWTKGLGHQLLFGHCPLKKWIHLAFVYDNTNKKYRFYLNGKKIKEGNETIVITGNRYPLLFGSETKSSGDPDFLGLMASIRISSIARYHKNFTPPCTFSKDAACLGLWQVDDGGGSTLKDTSGHQRHGSIKGATWHTGRSCNKARYGSCIP